MLAIAPSNPQVVYTGSDGGIWRSVNNGTTWTSLNNFDFSATQFQGVAVHPYDRNFLMGGTQDNGTICWAANGTVSHCRDGDGGYAQIDGNAQDTTNVTMYHTFFNQIGSQIAFERASSTAANADGQLSGWTSRGCSGFTSNNGMVKENVLFTNLSWDEQILFTSIRRLAFIESWRHDDSRAKAPWCPPAPSAPRRGLESRRLAW